MGTKSCGFIPARCRLGAPGRECFISAPRLSLLAPEKFRYNFWPLHNSRLFFMLAYADFTGGSKTLAGYEGIFCGLSACYAAIAQVLNEIYGRAVLPL